jgi:hypothetical protein
MKKTDESKDCPFCGCGSIHVLGPKTRPLTSSHGRGYQVECINCGARGPCGMRTRKDAMLVWIHGEKLEP